LYDDVSAHGSFTIGVGANPIRFTSKCSGFPDEIGKDGRKKENQAEISNDTTEFKNLMIIGNKSAGFLRSDGAIARTVSVWDRLEVNGELFHLLTRIETQKLQRLTGNQGYPANVINAYMEPIKKYFKGRLENMKRGNMLQALETGSSDVIWTGYKDWNGKIKVGSIKIEHQIEL
jgi:hypothetical protein